MDKTPRVIDLGPTSENASFDDAFFAAKRLIDDGAFDIDVVSITVDGTPVRITANSTAFDAFERFTVDRGQSS